MQEVQVMMDWVGGAILVALMCLVVECACRQGENALLKGMKSHERPWAFQPERRKRMTSYIVITVAIGLAQAGIKLGIML